MPFSAADVRFRQLWQHFGRPGTEPRAYYPFGRLRNDEHLWEIPEEPLLSTAPGADILVSEARQFAITGGFRQEVYEPLRRYPSLVSHAAHQLLSDHFPASIHGDILEAVGLGPALPSLDFDDTMPRRGRRVREYVPRDPQFRKDVLKAYGGCCAVCEHDTRFRDRFLGLEAAHIRWHSHNGGDVVSNGLALCSLHHKALDYGALGLEAKRSGFEILISSKVRGKSPSTRELLKFKGKPIRPPLSPSDAPQPRFVEWHRHEVFHP